MTVKLCSVDDCGKKSHSLGFCPSHYQRFKRYGDPLKVIYVQREGCLVSDCENKHHSGGYCSKHHASFRKYGDPLKASSRKGYTLNNGYMLLSGYKDHPNAQPSTGKIFEHILVMSEHLGRPLLSEENVHHKNGVRTDNRLENLELWSKAQPYGQRVEDKIAWAKEILAFYGEKL